MCACVQAVTLTYKVVFIPVLYIFQMSSSFSEPLSMSSFIHFLKFWTSLGQFGLIASATLPLVRMPLRSVEFGLYYYSLSSVLEDMSLIVRCPDQWHSMMCSANEYLLFHKNHWSLSHFFSPSHSCCGVVCAVLSLYHSFLCIRSSMRT
jgi:hypothetical protein